MVHRALMMHEQGRFAESVELWRDVLSHNVNFELAYLGIGRGLARSGELRESLWYLRRANNRQAYSEAFELYRSEFVGHHFNTIVYLFTLLVVSSFLFAKRRHLADMFKRRRLMRQDLRG